MGGRIIQPGDRYIVKRIVQPDYDAYAVIYYGKGWIAAVGKEWFKRERPEVGDSIVMGTDNQWHVEKP